MPKWNLCYAPYLETEHVRQARCVHASCYGLEKPSGYRQFQHTSFLFSIHDCTYNKRRGQFSTRGQDAHLVDHYYYPSPTPPLLQVQCCPYSVIKCCGKNRGEGGGRTSDSTTNYSIMKTSPHHTQKIGDKKET